MIRFIKEWITDLRYRAHLTGIRRILKGIDYSDNIKQMLGAPPYEVKKALIEFKELVYVTDIWFHRGERNDNRKIINNSDRALFLENLYKEYRDYYKNFREVDKELQKNYIGKLERLREERRR